MPRTSRPPTPVPEAGAKPQPSSSPPRQHEPQAPPNNAAPKPFPPKTTPTKTSSPRKPPKPAVAEDPASYYGYLFDKKKKPTRVLDALLRAIGQHIINEIGNKDVKFLTTDKLSAFYHAVGGDMDFLLRDQSSEDISALWAVYGCQHMLTQPNGDSRARPTVPTLTLRGFVEWEALQILLNPEDHSIWIRTAVKKFGLKHPETGEGFPADLPKSSLPSECDPVIDAYHDKCIQVLKEEEEERKRRSRSRASSGRSSHGDAPPKPPRQTSPDPRFRYTAVPPETRAYAAKPGTTYVRVPPVSTQRNRSGTDPEPGYTTRPTYGHVPGSSRYEYSERRSPERAHEHERYERFDPRTDPRADPRATPRQYVHVRAVSPDADARRRSFSDYPTPNKDAKEKDSKTAAHSLSDPQLKGRPSANATAPPGATSRPPAAAGGGPSVPIRPPLHRSHPPPPHFESETESSESESDDSVANNDGEGGPGGGGRAPRRRIHRPAPHPTPLHAHTGGEPSVIPGVSRIYHERIPSGERVTTSGVHPGITVLEPGSPRIRPAPVQNHSGSNEPRRRSIVDSAIHKAQTAAQFLVGSGSNERRARSHGERNDRYRSGGSRLRYASDNDLSESDSDDDRRRRRGPPGPRPSAADRERELIEQNRRRLERERQNRDWEREDGQRSRRYLSRPDPPTRRTSSHADVDRRRDREYSHGGYDSRDRAPRRYTQEMRYEA